MTIIQFNAIFFLPIFKAFYSGRIYCRKNFKKSLAIGKVFSIMIDEFLPKTVGVLFSVNPTEVVVSVYMVFKNPVLFIGRII
jgi:hypothetical protein